MRPSVRSLIDVFREPVRRDVRDNLRRSWESLPAQFRTPQQMFGRQGNPCGATIGTMPRCDFACRGCYLGEEANHIPPEGVEAIKAQMRALRPLLGHNGNLQLTDGEVTLRDEAELVELLRYADSIDLVPMLMTHGDSFRRNPGLLERLMVEGGLREIGIHVDTTMRGRVGEKYKHATVEAELNPLREEFARLIREARKRTGRTLVAATTMTVTRGNLAGVKDVVRCVSQNADAFKMISFQPAAAVGRTESGVEGVDVEALWSEAARGLTGEASDPAYLWKARMYLGHHACNRYVHGWVVQDGDGPGRFVSLRQEGDALDERAVEGYMARFGGVSFRRDTKAVARTRALGMLVGGWRYWLGTGLPYFWHQARKMDPAHPGRLAGRLMAGRAQAPHFCIVSHHFMSRPQIETTEGRERLDLCVFRVPIGERLVSMCEVNALGIRDAYYEDVRAGRPPGRELRVIGRASQAEAAAVPGSSLKTLSVVIPVFNEEERVVAAIESVRDHAEVVVVDGGSTDRTCERAVAAGARVLRSPPGRGRQLDVGARACRGDWIVFLHADTRLDPGWADALVALPPDVVGGAFRFTVDSRRPAYRWLERGVATRCRLLRLPYGDQALFARRQTYEAVGGFPPWPLMEDVAFTGRLRRAGRLAFPSVAAVTSARRWERHGILAATLKNWSLLARYALGDSPERLTRAYRRAPRSRRSCLLLFARAPALEAQAKGMGRARRLFDLSRERVVASAAALPGVDLVVVGSAPAEGVAHRLPQRGRGFAEKLRHAFADVRALGYDRIVAVPQDCPRLEVADLAEAFRHLERGRPVLGPSPDGGVYLLGVTDDPDGWLRGIHWRTPRVFQQLLAGAPDAAQLPLRADIDVPADLGRLLEDPALGADVADEVRRLLETLPPWFSASADRRRRGVASPLDSRPPPAGV